MNNDVMIVRAIKLLDTTGIVEEDKKTGEKYILKTFRGQISSFGAAVEMGSLLSAVAFFSNSSGSITDRSKLMQAIYLLINEIEDNGHCDNSSLLEYVAENYTDRCLKRKIIDAAIALKLAMNAYQLRAEDESGDKYEDNNEDKKS